MFSTPSAGSPRSGSATSSPVPSPGPARAHRYPPPRRTGTRMDLDHVALATRDVRDAIDVLVGELGGIVLFGGDRVGFPPRQRRLGAAPGGMNVELPEPGAPERNDFLERFVDRHGPGPHHLTFKVDDLGATLDLVRTAGYQPINIDVSDPEWKEAFLHPREAHGTVVQL